MAFKNTITEKYAVTAAKFPKWDDKVFHRLFKLPKYNAKVNVYTAHGSDAGKILIYLFPDWTKDDYVAAAQHYQKEDDRLSKQWSDAVRKVHKAATGEEWKPTDYKVSGVGRDDYPDEEKEKLRELAHGGSYNGKLKAAADHAAKLVNRVKVHRLSEDEKDHMKRQGA